MSSGPVSHPQSLLRKLNYRENHSLLPWVKAEVESRFDFRCCDSIEEFQNSPDFALTTNRHVKFRDVRHEKDDREKTVDRRNFVLGWENKEKQRYLVEQIRVGALKRDSLNDRISELDGDLKGCRYRLESVKRAAEVVDFSSIDHAVHRQAATRMQRELESLENADDQRKILKQKLKETESRRLGLRQSRDETVRVEAVLNEKIEHAGTPIGTASKYIRAREADGSFALHAKYFPAIGTECPALPNTIEELHDQEKSYLKRRQDEQTAVEAESKSFEDQITPCMSRFLQESPEERANLDASIKSLSSFLALREKIIHEGLPRHEERFKERLNEKVTHEIGLLNGELADERGQIARKIEQLNGSLRQVEYNPGTFMQLEPKPVRNREVLDFQAALRNCLADAFEGSFEADEARFVRISKLIERLRTEERWREHVTDVRRWFDFVACERDLATNAERGYYEDSSGQSGGEKAKLAFTILVASLAYQFDLDPQLPNRSRFHFVVVDEMFSKVDDRHAEYALELFKKFGLQLLIVAPLDAKARVTEPYVGCYLNVVKDAATHRSEIFSMTARQFEESLAAEEGSSSGTALHVGKPR